MSKVVGIIKYGIAGNIKSIENAIIKAGADVIIIDSADKLDLVGRIVLPGVGSFHEGMEELQKSGLLEPVKTFKKPVLGICLGMQIFSKIGFEYGKKTGLEIINAEVKRMECEGPVPHVGFNSIKLVRDNPLFKELQNECFYFMHSYEVVNYVDVISLTEYANHEFVSAVHKDNFYGVQFHPEKSRDAGIKLFQNFINL